MYNEKNNKKKMNEPNKNTHIDTENRVVVTSGEDGGGQK